MPSPRLILASASPRRLELMRAAGFAFEVDPADIDEDNVPAGLAPDAIATYLARAKATHVARRHTNAVILGADTIVALDGAIYGKAETPDAALAMLRTLGGRRQRVITGIAIIPSHDGGGHAIVEAVTSEVDMRAMTDAELEGYVATDDWRGKAGAYGIQDHDPASDPFVRLVSGAFSNVVGLPIERVTELLASVGIRPTDARSTEAAR